MPEQPRLKRRYLVIAGALFLFVGVLAGRPHQPSQPCTGVDARRAWFTSTPRDGRSPENEGFRILGECSTKLLHREFSCEESSVRTVNADNPYLKEALALGFVTYVCESPSGSRMEYALQPLLVP